MTKKFVMPEDPKSQLAIFKAMAGFVEKTISSQIPVMKNMLKAEMEKTSGPAETMDLRKKARTLRMHELCLHDQLNRLKARIEQLSGITE